MQRELEGEEDHMEGVDVGSGHFGTPKLLDRGLQSLGTIEIEASSVMSWSRLMWPKK